jgi:hypothetical protein
MNHGWIDEMGEYCESYTERPRRKKKKSTNTQYKMEAVKKDEKSTKVVTGKVRFSFLTVFVPKPDDAGQLKYSTQLLIPKTDTKTVDDFNNMVKKVFADNTAMLGKNIKAANLKICFLRDGDEEKPDDENYAGMWFVNAKSNKAPGVVKLGEEKGTVEKIGPDDIKSGDYGKASINFFAFGPPKQMKAKGIACGLQNILFLEEGETLSGKSNAAADFADSATGFDDLD